jgi:hypothetical protein
MNIQKISNAHLKRAIEILGIDDVKLITLTNNYHAFRLKNAPADEFQVLKIVTDYGQRLKASRAKQKKYVFWEIQSDDFLLKTDEQQDCLINKLQSELVPINPAHFQNFDAILSLCKELDLDLIPVINHIEEAHPYFIGDITPEELQAYLDHFKENDDIYRRIDTDTARVYSDIGYRRIGHHLCAPKSR